MRGAEARDLDRYPPTGDVRQWVHYGPDGPTGDNWRGRTLRNHEHTAAEEGDTCAVCGFPWWPNSSPVVGNIEHDP